MKLYFAKEFTSYPHGRNESDGKFNGQAFHELLTTKFREAEAKNEPLEVVLDDVHGLSGGFIHESFGELSRKLKEEGKTLSEDNLRFSANKPHYRIYAKLMWDHIKKHHDTESHAVSKSMEYDGGFAPFFYNLIANVGNNFKKMLGINPRWFW